MALADDSCQAEERVAHHEAALPQATRAQGALPNACPYSLTSMPRQHCRRSMFASADHTRTVVPNHMDRPMKPSMRSAFHGPCGRGGLLAAALPPAAVGTDIMSAAPLPVFCIHVPEGRVITGAARRGGRARGLLEGPCSAPAAASTARLWASKVGRPCKTSFSEGGPVLSVGRRRAFANVPLLLCERVVNDATGGTSRKVEGGGQALVQGRLYPDAATAQRRELVRRPSQQPDCAFSSPL